MKFKNVGIIVLMSFMLLITSGKSFATLSQTAIKVLVPSEKRFVADLSGGWDRSVDMDVWSTVNLPRSEINDTKVIFKRVVKIPSGMTDNYTWQLFFMGIDHQIEVYWNEQFIGRYVGAMTPFTVRIPEKTVRNDANEIRLVVLPAEGKINQIRSQQLNSKQYYTGILRDILLIGTPQVWVSDIKIKTKIKSENSADIFADVSISSTEVRSLVNKLISKDSLNIKTSDKVMVTLNAELRKRGTTEILATTTSKSIIIESDRTVIEGLSMVVSGINLWSFDSPELYELIVKIKRNELVIDDYSSTIGFRNIIIANSGENKNILTNGNLLKIKGISYVEDLEGNGQTLTEAKVKQDIDLIKKLGANIVRVKFNAPHPLFIHYCNLAGLMVIIDLPVYEIPSAIINIDEVKIHMQNIARQYITRYNNDPSVIAWGIGAGINEDENYQKFAESIIKLFNSDSEKLIYKIVPFGCSEIYIDGFDFIGYSDTRNHINLLETNSEFKRIQGLISGKPLFMAFGSEIQINNHNGYSDPLSLEFQAYNILNSYKIVEKNKGAGCVVNTFNDYLQNKPSLITNNTNSYINTSGLLSRARDERLSFTTLQALFNGEKEPLLNAGSYSPSSPVAYLIFGIAIAVLLVLLINRFRRFREYMFRSLLRPYNFYADIRDQRIISSIQTLLLGVIISFAVGIFLSSIMFYFKESTSLEYLIMILLPSNMIKEFVYGLIWMPELSMLMIAFISFTMAILTGWAIRMIAILSRARIYWSDCLTISIWAALPAIFLLPLSIIVMRLMVMSPGLVSLFLFIYSVTSIWTVIRLLKSISVVFDIPSIRAYIIGGVFIFLLFAIPIGYFHVKYSFFDYWSYFTNIMLM